MLAQKLKEYRKRNDLTQQDLAEKLFVSRSAVAKWEQAKGMPGKDVLAEICLLLNCTKDELLSEDEAVTIIEHVEKSSKKKVVVSYIVTCVVIIALIVLSAFSVNVYKNGKLICESVSPDKEIVLKVYDKPQTEDKEVKRGYTVKISGKYRGTWVKENCDFIGLYWSGDSRYVVEEFYSYTLNTRYFEYSDFYANRGVNLQLILSEKLGSYYSVDVDTVKSEFEFIRWDETTDIMLFNFSLIYDNTYVTGYFWSSPTFAEPLQGLVETKRIEK